MEENPLEQQKLKIDALKDEAKKEFSLLFDNKGKELNNKFDRFISKLENYQQNGIVFDKDKIINSLKENMSVEDKEVFVTNLLKAFESIIAAKATQSDLFKKIEAGSVKENRESIINDVGNIRLSEVLYAGLSNKSVHIHLADAYDYVTKEKIGDFNREIIIGLQNLAKMIEPMKNIEKVTATSWIVAVKGSAKRLKKLGFTIEGEISDEERKKHFSDDNRSIQKAFITREDFLKKYGKENLV